MKLSIIIPCYNCASTLREAVASCYTQGFSEDEFEIVMVDDASTDDTRQLMEELATEHKNILLAFHDKNQGGGATRNTAVEHTQSDVIFCLDSDDLLPPQTLNKMLAYLHTKRCDGVCFERSVKFRGRDTTDIVHVDTFQVSDTPVAFTSLLQIGILSPVLVVFMYTKHAFKTISGYPSHHGFDTQGFGWRFLSAGLHVFACPNTTYLHRVQFTESYYLREYNLGKNNYHMQEILLEHLPLFSPKAQQKIASFPYNDFTRDILVELKKIDPILIADYQKLFGTLEYKENASMKTIPYIPRNSLQGIGMRIRYRIRELLKLI